MVNFTCNKCGDSLKKKDVILHFSRNMKCRQASSLTCFDCLKEFGENYISHNICVSENQRYGANGLKGIEKSKQQAFTESVHQHFRSILANKDSSLSKIMVNLLEHLLNNPIIPRKEKSFLNMVRNAARFPEDAGRTAWTMVSEIIKQQDNQAKANNTPKSDMSKKGNDIAPSTNGETHTMENEAESAAEVVASGEKVEEDKDVSKKQKKKKKSKKAAVLSSEEVMTADTNQETSSDLTESKKQKKKRQKSESAETSQTNGHSHDATMEVEEQSAMEVEGQAAMEVEGQDGSETKIEEEKLSKKEKKLKKKKEKYEAEMKAVEAAKTNEGQTEDIEEPALEGGKKKKSKKQTLEAEEDVETDKKSKKKRERTVSMAAEAEQPKKKNKQKGNGDGDDENTVPNEEIQEAVPNRKEFKWADVIIQVLQSQNDNEMSVKRLCKKVVNEYLSSLLEGTHVDEVKATAKFQKKLQKTPGVFVHKDKAKLKSSE